MLLGQDKEATKMSKRKPQKSFNFNNERNQIEIEMLRKFLKKQILCPETKFRHHINERAHVLDLVKRTIENGESNSLLLIGPRGSGKTTVSKRKKKKTAFHWIL